MSSADGGRRRHGTVAEATNSATAIAPAAPSNGTCVWVERNPVAANATSRKPAVARTGEMTDG